MGNRAAVVFKDSSNLSPLVYLHWNGGPESVYAFLEELKRRGSGNGSAEYMAARFAHVVGDFFDNQQAGNYSLGVFNGPKSESREELDKFVSLVDDNGLYLVSTYDWTVSRYITTGRCKDGFHHRKLTKAAATKEQLAALKDDKYVAITAFLRSFRPFLQDHYVDNKPASRVPAYEEVKEKGKAIGTDLYELDGSVLQLYEENGFKYVHFVGPLYKG